MKLSWRGKCRNWECILVFFSHEDYSTRKKRKLGFCKSTIGYRNYDQEGFGFYFCNLCYFTKGRNKIHLVNLVAETRM